MVLLALCVLLVPAVLLLVSRPADALSPDRAPNPLPQLAAFAPWAIPLWASAAAVAAASGRWTAAGPAVVALIVQRCWVIPSRRPTARPGPVDREGIGREGIGHQGDLTLVTVNALLGRADPAAIAGLVARAGCDVLVVQELTPELAHDLAERLHRAGLRQAALHPAPGGAGTGIWSRRPIRPLRLLPTRACAMPQILAGDFNASRDHAGFRAILAAGPVDAADVAGSGTGWGAGFTWPADRPWPPLTRLDHVLVSDGIAVHRTSVEVVRGTDHRAVIARLGLPVAADDVRRSGEIRAGRYRSGASRL